MSASQGDLRDVEPPSSAEINPDPHSEEASLGAARLALILMTELGACLQMITSDIARATNLDEASARWSQRLMALAMVLERATGRYTAHIGRHNRDLPYIASAPHGTMQSQQALLTQHSNPSAPLTYSHPHSLKLTAREREIVALTRRGYPPRQIAKRLQLSVETVYTHLRNARRKLRLLDFPTSSQ